VLCEFLDLPYDDAMLRFHEGRTKTDPSLDAKKAWRPLTAGLRDWRSQMPAEDVEQFEAAAGDFLSELGYPRAVPYPSPESLERAGNVRELLARDANWRHALSRPGTADRAPELCLAGNPAAAGPLEGAA
jgi:hypothetical protein